MSFFKFVHVAWNDMQHEAEAEKSPCATDLLLSSFGVLSKSEIRAKTLECDNLRDEDIGM